MNDAVNDRANTATWLNEFFFAVSTTIINRIIPTKAFMQARIKNQVQTVLLDIFLDQSGSVGMDSILRAVFS